MSGHQPTPEESRAWDAAFLTFPHAHRGKHFRTAAKRLARCTGISYDEALNRLNQAAVGAAYRTALAQIRKEVER